MKLLFDQNLSPKLVHRFVWETPNLVYPSHLRTQPLCEPLQGLAGVMPGRDGRESG